MIAFAIRINGKKACTAGVNHAGVIAFLAWKAGKAGPDMPTIRVQGSSTRSSCFKSWLSRKLKVGDEVQIQLLDTPRGTPAKRKLQVWPSAKERLRREQKYVKTRAAAWGWQIRKAGNGNKSPPKLNDVEPGRP